MKRPLSFKIYFLFLFSLKLITLPVALIDVLCGSYAMYINGSIVFPFLLFYFLKEFSLFFNLFIFTHQIIPFLITNREKYESIRSASSSYIIKIYIILYFSYIIYFEIDNIYETKFKIEEIFFLYSPELIKFFTVFIYLETLKASTPINIGITSTVISLLFLLYKCSYIDTRLVPIYILYQLQEYLLFK